MLAHVKTGAVIAVGIVVGAAATLALTYRSVPVVAPSAAVAAAPAVRSPLPRLAAVSQPAPVAPVQSLSLPPPAEPPVAPPPPPVIAEQGPETQQSADSSDEAALPAEEPHLSDAGERHAFNAARQHNASVANPSSENSAPEPLRRD